MSARLLGKFVLGNFVMGNFGAHPAQACRLKQQSAIFLFFSVFKGGLFVKAYFSLRAGAIIGSLICLSAMDGAPAFAQANILRECGSKYQAAKAANELAGQNWQEYLKACRARLAETSKPQEAAAPTTPAAAGSETESAKPTPSAAPLNTPVTPAVVAAPGEDKKPPVEAQKSEKDSKVVKEAAKPVKGERGAQKTSRKISQKNAKSKRKN